MMGFSVGFLKSLDENEEDYNIIVVEEPELYKSRKLYKYQFSFLHKVILTEYQNSNKYLEDITSYISDMDIAINAVVPALEYAVPASVKLSKHLGLPGASIKNENILSDKLTFREHCEEYGIPQPNYTKVNNIKDVRKFFKNFTSIILKPTNRQASLGVIKVFSESEIEDAIYEIECLDVAEQKVRTEGEENIYLAEQCVFGKEVSSEVLVQNRKIVFENITDKVTTKGKYSIELGHTVPSLKSDFTIQQLNSLTQRFIHSLGFCTGVLHIEWILTEEGPKIIECAGRPPGDFIFNLINHAYQINIYDLLIRMLSGHKIEEIITPKKAAAVHFFNPREGVIKNILGLEIFEHASFVIDYALTVKVGDHIQEFKSSWDRVGYLIVEGENPEIAQENIKSIIEGLIIETEN